MNQAYDIIDGHVHLFQNEPMASKIIEVFNKRYDVRFRTDGKGTAEDLADKMTVSGIKRSIVANFGMPKHVDRINRWTLALAASDRRFVSLISLHPGMTDLSPAILSEYKSLGARGIKLHPMSQDFDPLDNAVFPCYEEAGKIGFPVVFHCGRISNMRPNSWSDTDHLVKVIKLFPGTVFVLTHMADGNAKDVCDIAGQYENVRFDTSVVVSGNKDLCEHNDRSWKDDDKCVSVFRTAGVEKFLFGSDYPWGSPGEDLVRIQGMTLTDDEKRMILGANAKKIFNLD